MRSGFIAAVALVISCAVQAAGPTLRDHNRFKWRDAEGNLHYSDALPAEAVKNGYEVVNPQGIVIKRVDRMKSAEERAAAKAELAKAAAAKEEAAMRARNDQQMLAAYPTEDDLKRAQHQQSEMLDQNLVSARISLESQEKSLADLLGHAAELDRSGKPVPTTVSRQIATLRKEVEDQRAYIQRKEDERAAANQRFADEISHYRDLKSKLAADRR